MTNATSARLKLNAISKRYGSTQANHNIDLELEPAQIHALLGENGAGKSTLMKIIFGMIKPDSGSMQLDGVDYQPANPAAARRANVGMVFQHFSLFANLSVAENIALGLDASAARNIGKLKKRISKVSARYGLGVEPNRLVQSLSVGEKQRVEIVRCLLQNIKLLILDEPTSVLTPNEVKALFVTLQSLAKAGCSILFISHKLQEVIELCDAATILRHGKVVATCNPQTMQSAELAAMMVGSELALTPVYKKNASGKTVLWVKNLSYQPNDDFGSALRNISLKAKAGEILGIAGVAGNGQDELLALLSGEICSSGDNIQFQHLVLNKLGAQARRKLGMAFAPEERLSRGGVSSLSLLDNALLSSSHKNLAKNGFINKAQLGKFTKAIISKFNVQCASYAAPAGSLSGGNLQKFIMGREISQQPKLLLCSHPTWGVDVGAAASIHEAMIALRDTGTAIIVVSEDLDELFAISDRLCAICLGQLSPIVKTRELSLVQLGQWMAGDFTASQSA